tara:strand:+ start:26 stop:550 length:525 start_codon:yes stop_codon:yes gene_type:complete
MSEDSPSPETSLDLKSTQVLQQEVERLQQRIDELEGENKPTRSSAFWTGVFTFLALFFLGSLYGVFMVFVMPKTRMIYLNLNLWPNPDAGTGPDGYRLPAISEFFRTIVHFPKDNFSPLHWFISFLVLAAMSWCMGFKRFYLSQNTCRNIDRISLCLYTGLIICWFIASYLPFQ